MHGVREAGGARRDVTEYRQRFELRYRNRHRLEADDHPMERVLAGEAFRDVVVEVAPAGEEEPRWTHSVRSLVLTDDAGEPDCLALVLHDATERFDAEERFERAFASQPGAGGDLPACRPALRQGQPGFLEMTGYEREDVIGRSVYELDVLEGAEQKELAVERLNARAHHPADGGRAPAARAAGARPSWSPASRSRSATSRCMLFTFVDLEPRRAGRGGAAPERGALRQGVPVGAGARR